MPEIPEGAKRPQDRKKKKKPKKPRETIEFRGETYTLQTAEIRDDQDVIEAVDSQRYSIALRLILGEREYARLKSNLADKKGRTKASDVFGFFKKLIEDQQDLGN